MTAQPIDLLEIQAYFKRAVELLNDWLWLFKTRPVDILKEELLESNSPLLQSLASLNIEDLNRVPFGLVKDEWPADLKRFIQQCNALILIPETAEEEFTIVGRATKISPKKLHETSRLAPFIARVCREHGASAVIDIGAGLGHIDRAICRLMPNCLVVAVECDSVLCDSADQTNLKAGLEANIAQLNLSINADSIDEVCSKLQLLCSDRAICLVALHACGDLTVNCFDIFQRLDRIKCSVLLSCCYHRMKNECTNFPLSVSLKETTGSRQLESSRVNLLRLAAETTRDSWKDRTLRDHQFHSNHVFFRGLIEKYITKESFNGAPLSDNLNPGRTRIPRFQTWDDYINCWMDKVGPKLTVTIDRENMLRELQELFLIESHLADLVTPFNCLQTCLQGVAESLVTIDRMAALMERGVGNVRIVKIFDRKISPRCNALVLSK